MEVFRTYYGPVHKAFLALPPEQGARLGEAMLALINGLDRGGGTGLVVPSDYLEVVIRRPHTA